MSSKLLGGFLELAREIGRLPRVIFGYNPVVLSAMDYDEYWDEVGEHQADNPRIAIICEMCEEGASVLDLGCGDGRLLARLVSQRNVRASGMDISTEALRIASKRGLTDLQQVDLMSPSFELSSEHDYIVCTEVLEHVAHPERVLAKVRGHFRKALIVSVPNTGYYPQRLRLLFGKFPLQWGRHPGEHLRFWTVSDFRWWVELQGYEIIHAVAADGFPLLLRIWPSLFANQMVFVLRLAEAKNI